MPPVIPIDLRLPPAARWRLTPSQCDQARTLLRSYQADLGLSAGISGPFVVAARPFVPPDHWAELESLARHLSLSVADVALCNFYYDALKVTLGHAFGCTAFAVDAPGGILHARNLDWWSPDDALARCTAVCRFTGAPAGSFTTIGWPGFLGAFSGIAPGRFAVSLNAVLSEEPAQPGIPSCCSSERRSKKPQPSPWRANFSVRRPSPATVCCC